MIKSFVSIIIATLFCSNAFAAVYSSEKTFSILLTFADKIEIEHPGISLDDLVGGVAIDQSIAFTTFTKDTSLLATCSLSTVGTALSGTTLQMADSTANADQVFNATIDVIVAGGTCTSIDFDVAATDIDDEITMGSSYVPLYNESIIIAASYL